MSDLISRVEAEVCAFKKSTTGHPDGANRGDHWSLGIHPGHCEHVLAKHEIETSNPYPEQVSRFVYRLMCIHHNVQICKLFSHLWVRGRVRVGRHSIWVNLSRGSFKLNTVIIFLGQKSHVLTIN